MTKKKLMNFNEIDNLADKLATFVKPSDVIVLIGDLGTGKTTFAKRFAKDLGVSENLKSPTFNYVLSYYSGRLPLHHFDVYRISDPMEVYEIGYEDFVSGDGVCLIEWGDLIASELPSKYIEIKIAHNDETSRYVELAYIGDSQREKEMYNHVGLSH